MKGLYRPCAHHLEQGHSVVTSEGEALGAVPFSAYATTVASIVSHAGVLHRFTEVFLSRLALERPAFGGGFINKP